MSIHTQAVRSFLVSAAALAIATPAWAQTEEEQQAQAATPPEAAQGDLIIVTATKRASTVQDVPFSINAQTQEDIQRANASTIEDISRNVAGLAVQNLGPGQSQVSVRGVSAGQVIRDQPGVKEQVGVYLDESVISLSLFTPDIDLYDLNRVETLRGPQGTLFGSGSVGGTIRYITNQPRLGRTEGSVEANLNHVHDGEFGGHLKGAINLPIGETLAARGVAYYQKYAGFIDALGPAGGKDVNDGVRYGGRLSLLWQPIEELKITPRVVYQKVESDGFNRQEVFNLYHNDFTDGPDAFDEREQFLLLREEFEDKTLLADLTASYDFGGLELTSITSYIDREIVVSRDASALTGSISVDVGFPEDVVLLPSNLIDTTDLKTFTQEVRLASTNDSPFQWLIGGFYSDVERDYGQFLPTPGYAAAIDAAGDPGDAEEAAGPFDPDSPFNSIVPFDIKQKALFGEASYDFGRLTATAGLRWFDFKEERSLLFQGFFTGLSVVEQETSSSGFNPRFLLSYDVNNNLTFNAQASKGFRLGGVNDPLNIPICEPEDIDTFGPFAGEYNDETLWNYEAGMKYSKGRLTFNAAVFHTKIRDLQVTLDAGSCSSRIVFNVDKAHTTGVEMEIGATPIPGLDLSLAGSYVSAEFDSTVTSAGEVVGGIREGNRLPSVPKFQMAATATYTQRFRDNADWYINASYQHVGTRFTQPGDQEPGAGAFAHGLPVFGMTGDEVTVVNLKLPSYDLVNVSAGLEFDSGLEVVLYVNNLFDENAILAFDRERGGRARLGFHVGQPRTIGITTRFKFGN